MSDLFTIDLNSPIGHLRLVASPVGLREILFASELDQSPSGAGASAPNTASSRAFLDLVARQLDEYFAGTRHRFDVPLDPSGRSFSQSVWVQLLGIPYGTTISYGELADRLGIPRAARAVGRAVGANPIPIIVPCHRVVGASGALTGYSGGLGIKEFLLARERCSVC